MSHFSSLNDVSFLDISFLVTERTCLSGGVGRGMRALVEQEETRTEREKDWEDDGDDEVVDPAPYTLHLAPYTLHPTPSTLHLTLYILRYNLHLTPFTYTLNSVP